MAKVVNPFMSGQAKGSVGSMTATMWKGTAVMHQKQNPARRLRPVQTNNRAKLGYLARVWGQSLSDGEREQWRDWAASHPQPNGFGGTFIMSGQQAFIQLNHRAMRVFTPATFIKSPPIANLHIGMGTLTLSTPAVDGKITIAWTLMGTGLAADRCEISIAGPFASPGRMEVVGKFHYLYGAAGNAVTFDYTLALPGAWYFARVRYVQLDGQVSAWLQGQVQAGETP
jgi:hypothetical protein